MRAAPLASSPTAGNDNRRAFCGKPSRTFPPAAPTHVLCTDVARDGALVGAESALYAEAARRFPGVAWQASGGIRDAADLKALAACGAAAAISGKALLEELIPIEELRPFLPNA